MQVCLGHYTVYAQRRRDHRRGECRGTLAYAPQGENGFGYDPVFFVPEKKKTFAQLTGEEKNAISHRGNALKEFQIKLERYLNGSNK